MILPSRIISLSFGFRWLFEFARKVADIMTRIICSAVLLKTSWVPIVLILGLAECETRLDREFD